MKHGETHVVVMSQLLLHRSTLLHRLILKEIITTIKIAHGKSLLLLEWCWSWDFALLIWNMNRFAYMTD